jgi:hypothetical protein
LFQPLPELVVGGLPFEGISSWLALAKVGEDVQTRQCFEHPFKASDFSHLRDLRYVEVVRRHVTLNEVSKHYVCYGGEHEDQNIEGGEDIEGC